MDTRVKESRPPIEPYQGLQDSRVGWLQVVCDSLQRTSMRRFTVALVFAALCFIAWLTLTSLCEVAHVTVGVTFGGLVIAFGTFVYLTGDEAVVQTCEEGQDEPPESRIERDGSVADGAIAGRDGGGESDRSDSARIGGLRSSLDREQEREADHLAVE